jgi:hypothetical protein
LSEAFGVGWIRFQAGLDAAISDTVSLRTPPRGNRRRDIAAAVEPIFMLSSVTVVTSIGLRLH